MIVLAYSVLSPCIIIQVQFYVTQSEADNHAVREAACACIAELATKLDKDRVRPHVSKLLDTLKVCFQDDSWPVRDGKIYCIIILLPLE